MANELQVRRGTDLQTRHADEARELVRLAFEELAGAVDGLHSIHGSIAGRAFRPSGVGGAPAHWVHGRVAGPVYGGRRGSTIGMGRIGAGALAGGPHVGSRVVSTTPRGAAVVA